MKITVFLLFSFFVGQTTMAQLLHPIVGAYKGKSAQGMAIWEDRAYLFNDEGHCRVINLVLGKMEKEFDLASSDKKPHINNACFGLEAIGQSSVPVIYISETNYPHRCYVENINGGKPELLQIIEAKEHGKIVGNNDWVVDRRNNFLYAINRKWEQYLDEIGNVNNIITKYRLPKLNEGKMVTLTERDVIDKFEIIFDSGMQGAKILNGILYIVAGLDEMNLSKIGTKRCVIVVDLKKKRIKKRIDLTHVTTNEPEDIDFWGKKCIMYCGQNGGLYKIKVK